MCFDLERDGILDVGDANADFVHVLCDLLDLLKTAAEILEMLYLPTLITDGNRYDDK